MARRKAKHKIDKKTIVDAFIEMAKAKNIDRDLLQGILEETLSMVVRKKYGQDANFEIIVNLASSSGCVCGEFMGRSRVHALYFISRDGNARRKL